MNISELVPVLSMEPHVYYIKSANKLLPSNGMALDYDIEIIQY